MIGIVDGSDCVRLATARHFEGEKYDGLHKLLPVMLGLTLPMLLPLTMSPGLVAPAIPLLYALMTAVAVAAVGVVVLTTLFKGQVVSVTVDPHACSLLLVHAGMFANARSRLPLDRVAKLEMVTVALDRRQSRQSAQLVTTTGRTYTLPDDITRSELMAFRAAITDARKRCEARAS